MQEHVEKAEHDEKTLQVVGVEKFPIGRDDPTQIIQGRRGPRCGDVVLVAKNRRDVSRAGAGHVAVV